MSRSVLARIVGLPARDRRLLLRAAAVVTAVRLGLWTVPFPVLRRVLAPLTRVRPRRSEPATSPDRIAWAVGAAARRVPRATCLTQALAAQVLLARGGWPSRLRLGVARDEGGRFEAHAWLEQEGRVLLDAAGPGRFVPLPDLDGPGR